MDIDYDTGAIEKVTEQGMFGDEIEIKQQED